MLERGVASGLEIVESAGLGIFESAGVESGSGVVAGDESEIKGKKLMALRERESYGASRSMIGAVMVV